MSEEQAPSLRQQIDDKVIDARNEVIMQATNAFLLGRQVVLVSLGLTALGVEQTHALLQQAVTRGEVVESDAQQTITRLRQQLGEGTTSAISSGLAGLFNKVPGVRIAYEAQSHPARARQRRQSRQTNPRVLLSISVPSGGNRNGISKECNGRKHLTLLTFDVRFFGYQMRGISKSLITQIGFSLLFKEIQNG